LSQVLLGVEGDGEVLARVASAGYAEALHARVEAVLAPDGVEGRLRDVLKVKPY
jgi:hypothetical protein